MNYIKKKSKKQEALTAQEFGGKVTPASGALSGSKGDVKTPDFLIENKFTDADKYKLELKTWKKIEEEAIREGLRIPMIQLDIQDLSLIIIDFNDLIYLLGERNKYFPVSYVTTPHKSLSLHKSRLAYLKDYFSVHVIQARGKQLAIISKEQYFLLDKN